MLIGDGLRARKISPSVVGIVEHGNEERQDRRDQAGEDGDEDEREDGRELTVSARWRSFSEARRSPR